MVVILNIEMGAQRVTKSDIDIVSKCYMQIADSKHFTENSGPVVVNGRQLTVDIQWQTANSRQL